MMITRDDNFVYFTDSTGAVARVPRSPNRPAPKPVAPKVKEKAKESWPKSRAAIEAEDDDEDRGNRFECVICHSLKKRRSGYDGVCKSCWEAEDRRLN